MRCFLLVFEINNLIDSRWDELYGNHDIVLYRGTDKSLVRPTSLCILFVGKNILFDASLFIYIYIVLILLQL
jgi:hypothetical protein